jgi:hypothetical protein
MATIKLKSSTGTRTVPSSLAQGEMAINVADGNLFYGDNSSNVNNDFRFAQVGVTGLTSGHTVHGVTVSGGSGGVYGTLQTAAQTNITSVGTLGATTLKTVTIAENETDSIPFLLTASEGTEGDWVRIGNSSGTFLSVGSGGRTTITSGIFNSATQAGGSINNTPIGASTASTGAFTVATLNNGTAGTPSLNFANDTDTGVRLHTAGNMRVVAAGADQVTFSDGAITPVADSDINLGHSSYYFKTLYIDDIDCSGDVDVDGTTNLDNTDIDGTLVVDGTNISLDSTATLNIDNSNTTNGITIGTATSGVPIQLGHSTSKVRINDDLTVTGNTVMNGTLSATTSLKVGNGDGTISANTVQGSYQFITFVGNTGALSNDYWTGPSTNGISNHSWTDQWDNHDGTSTGSTTLTLGRTEQMAYIRVPAGARLVGVEGVIRSNTNDRAYAGLFTFLPDYEGPNSADATLRILAQTPSSSNNVTNDPQSFKLYAGEANQHIFADGECIVPALRRDSSSNQTLIGSFTIILKY